jgi:hypothetical protein
LIVESYIFTWLRLEDGLQIWTRDIRVPDSRLLLFVIDWNDLLKRMVIWVV